MSYNIREVIEKRSRKVIPTINIRRKKCGLSTLPSIPKHSPVYGIYVNWVIRYWVGSVQSTTGAWQAKILPVLHWTSSVVVGMDIRNNLMTAYTLELEIGIWELEPGPGGQRTFPVPFILVEAQEIYFNTLLEEWDCAWDWAFAWNWEWRKEGGKIMLWWWPPNRLYLLFWN